MKTIHCLVQMTSTIDPNDTWFAEEHKFVEDDYELQDNELFVPLYCDTIKELESYILENNPTYNICQFVKYYPFLRKHCQFTNIADCSTINPMTGLTC
jgi:hypothetical protein